ncbi:Paf1 family protein [Candida parapsilosis]|uniref:Uncharacterized protein n=2 Tax=Candida parapsilosis TaxID=5480 RepID=G8BJQ9_CANPC|nr:uncharacterized protein CPAR2_406780 [Candida parapsilosis]KAF6045753.1 Paf1 family protein [Candida parapsilosis]KAF6046694.1 Paf1 family protein [Candida parapsilosis]KAF6046873.1 Paf1 family protein [Candida parapsilosis]KAF6050865.1 Paf1 family protein [Candida parapsilosis]KAF6062413.1 Paf1 family protein [Candida parapsilosis]
MSSRSSKPVRQDYIAKIRYTNSLPPPPSNPKLINYNTTTPISSQTEGDQLLSSLFRKENFRNLLERIDDQLGLELNLIDNVGFLDHGDASSIGQAKNKYTALHPKDRALLRDAGIGNIKRSDQSVSFLRRTEYISDQSLPKSTSTHTEENKVHEKLKNSEEHSLDAEHQLKAVEDSFTAANNSLNNLSSLKHPRKRNVKAVDAWPLLPDTSMMDNMFMNLRFLGSASIKRELDALKRRQGAKFNDTFQRQKLESTIFKPINSQDGEWISMFEVDNEEQVTKLHESLHSTSPENPSNATEGLDGSISEYNYKFVKNYDMHYQGYTNSRQELAVKFVPDEQATKRRKVAHYSPINGKIELRKHRASTNSEINKFIKERTYDAIQFRLREPTTDELKDMDRVRSEFDPMEYEGGDEFEDPES